MGLCEQRPVGQRADFFSISLGSVGGKESWLALLACFTLLEGSEKPVMFTDNKQRTGNLPQVTKRISPTVTHTCPDHSHSLELTARGPLPHLPMALPSPLSSSKFTTSPAKEYRDMEEECSDLVAGPLLPSEVCSSICIICCLTITYRGRKNTG